MDNTLPRPPAGSRPPPAGGATPPGPGTTPHAAMTPEHPISGATFWMLVYIPNFHGWKYIVADPSLTVDANALPGPQPTPTPHK